MNYEDIFQERGGAYHQAMRRWPLARRDDFALPLAWAALQPGERLIDVPAGGGYLKRHVPAGCNWFGHEPCASFQDDGGALNRRLLPLPWPDGFAHAAISIAGVHHLPDKRPLFRELARALMPGGRLVLADVHADSAAARFLDNFVGRHNSTGHQGVYLDDRTREELQSEGFRILRSERLRYCWWFADRAEMGAFCRLLFDIQGIENSKVADAIQHHLGCQARSGQVGLNWELLTVLATTDSPVTAR